MCHLSLSSAGADTGDLQLGKPLPVALPLQMMFAATELDDLDLFTAAMRLDGGDDLVEGGFGADTVLGGEGNGGIILPELHYGRDALIGTAMILQHLTNLEISLSQLLAQMPKYAMSKGKIPLGDLDADHVLAVLAEKFKNEKHSTIDGLKIDFADGWVHLRKSNTEPILRIYSEAPTQEEAKALAERFRKELDAVAAAAQGIITGDS